MDKKFLMNIFLHFFFISLIGFAIYLNYLAWFSDWPEKRYEIDMHNPLVFHSFIESIGKKRYIIISKVGVFILLLFFIANYLLLILLHIIY